MSAAFGDDLLPREVHELAAGPSSLLFMALGQVELASSLKLAIPDSLVRLVRLAHDGSPEHVSLFQRVITEGHSPEIWANIPGSKLLSGLSDFFEFVRISGQLIEIKDSDIDSQVAESLSRSFEDGDYEISLSPRKNFLRDYFVKIISWSKKTGGHIIESTKKNFVHLGNYIASLQIPDKADAIIKGKQYFINTIFGFRGGKAVKWIVGITVKAGVTIYCGPAAGFSLALCVAYIDP